MDEKHMTTDGALHEKGAINTTPTYDSNGDPVGQWRETESFMTRNGLNLQSFQRRPLGTKHVELDKSMKTRHLHMIAIGGSIGAGFFVGSGGALNTGVSRANSQFLCDMLTDRRALLRCSWIS
jgi:amino acid transporter